MPAKIPKGPKNLSKNALIPCSLVRKNIEIHDNIDNDTAIIFFCFSLSSKNFNFPNEETKIA